MFIAARTAALNPAAATLLVLADPSDEHTRRVFVLGAPCPVCSRGRLSAREAGCDEALARTFSFSTGLTSSASEYDLGAPLRFEKHFLILFSISSAALALFASSSGVFAAHVGGTS